MSETSDPGAEPGGGEEKPQPKQSEKQIEKIKADNEKKLELKEIKNEKFEKELKNEKFEKNELKELKHDKLEKDKPEIKEGKHEKEFKFEKLEKLEIKERKPEIEKQQIEGPVDPTRGVDPALLTQHADALEEAARQLRHFIEEGERPDLSRGALKDEPDQGGEA